MGTIPGDLTVSSHQHSTLAFSITLPPLLLLYTVRQLSCVYMARQQATYQHAQESLTDLEAKLSAVVQFTPDALVLANADGQIVFWNAGARKALRATRTKKRSDNHSRLIIPPRYREAHATGFRGLLRLANPSCIGRSLELNGLRKGGKEFPLELSLATWHAKGIRFFSAFLRDLTDRKRHETRQAIQLAISQVLVESQTVEQAGRQILQSVGHLTDWEVGFIWLLDSRSKRSAAPPCGRIRRSRWRIFSIKVLSRHFRLALGFRARVLASGEPFWITNVVKDDNFPRLDLARAADLHAAFGFPIKDSKGVVGVMEFLAQEVRPPDNSLLHTFSDIGIKVGQFIERRLSPMRASPSCAICKKPHRAGKPFEASWRSVPPASASVRSQIIGKMSSDLLSAIPLQNFHIPCVRPVRDRHTLIGIRRNTRGAWLSLEGYSHDEVTIHRPTR